MSTYTKALQKHLTQYKHDRLGVKEAGIFQYQGKEIRCGHILPRELKWLNLLESHRSEIRAYLAEHPDIKLHKYFHHLNSSQAFALNLFYPYFEGDEAASTALLRALEVPGRLKKWIPEWVPDAEEGTNVDVSWQNERGEWAYCEVKLSEQEFGKATHDRRHLDKLSRIYAPVLKPYCPAALIEPEQFFQHYQILRNIWLAAREPKASVVFLLPAANRKLWEGLDDVVDLMATSIRNRIHRVPIEKVIKTVASDPQCPPHLRWYGEQLMEKYVV